jgi:hypothetical protein
VVVGGEVGDPDLACTVVEARVQKCMREGAAGESRGSRAAVPMAPRVHSRVAEGVDGEWRGRPWD